MGGNKVDQRRSKKAGDKIYKPNPAGLLIASVVTIFVAEAIVMALLHVLEMPPTFAVGLIDAAMLSSIVIPTLYLMFFKPMRETILHLDKTEQIQKELEEIDKLKSDFISIASHELCTPVTTIVGYAEMLLDDGISAPQREYVNIILKKAETLERIIDDLTVVNRIEFGENLEIRKQNHDLLQTVKRVFNIYRARFPDKPMHLKLPDQPVFLAFDEIRISQVLDNLISNAVKYANDVHDRIDLSVIDEETQVRICLRDEGIGMTPSEVKQVYNKFFRAETEKSVVGGLGLGMAIVKNIVESHQGEIDIISQRKVGTTVTVTLPKAPDSGKAIFPDSKAAC